MSARILAPTILALSTIGAAEASPVLGMQFDVIENNLEQDAVTYRCLVTLENGARIDSVFGNQDSLLRIAPRDGRSFYQNPLGGPTSQSINTAFFPLIPSLEWDSFVTIGALDTLGSPFSDNELIDLGIDWEHFEAGAELFTNDGLWFIPPSAPQGQEVNGAVLIGQLTVLGGTGHAWADLDVMLNLQGTDADGAPWQFLGLTWVPAPSVLPALAFLLVGHRRRYG